MSTNTPMTGVIDLGIVPATTGSTVTHNLSLKAGVYLVHAKDPAGPNVYGIILMWDPDLNVINIIRAGGTAVFSNTVNTSSNINIINNSGLVGFNNRLVDVSVSMVRLL